MLDWNTTARDRLPASPLAVPLLWGAVVLFFGVGDVVTTGAGLASGVAAEAGPVVARAIAHLGLPGMVLLKAAVIGIAYLAWRLLPEPEAATVPLAFATVGVAVTAWNLQLLLAAGLA